MAIVSHSIDFTQGALGPGVNGNTQTGYNLDLQTGSGNKPIRLNSRSTAETSGSLIGLQCKPSGAGGSASTASVKGAEFSPRIASGTAGGDLIGGSFDPILQGSGTGDLSGVVRALELTITDGNAGVRTITGKSAALRIWSQLTSKTFTNGLFPIQVDTGGGLAWSGCLDLPNDGAVASKADAGENIPTGVTEYFRVNVGGVQYRCPLYHITN